MNTTETPQPTPRARFSGPTAPVRLGERLEILDILRGIAIFGILLVNMEFFFSPIYLAISGEQWWPGRLDRVAAALITFFAQGKFYALFSFLFGIGLAIQLERAEARGAPIAGFFARRMFWLLVIGLSHALLIWYGDILVMYSVLGFVLILFRKRKPKTLLVWTVVLLLLPVLLQLMIVSAVELGRSIPEAAEGIDEALEASRASTRDLLQIARATYTEGSLAEILAVRAREWATMFFSGLFMVGPELLALFLIGLYCGRRRLFHDPRPHVPRIRRSIGWLLAAGIVGNALLVVGKQYGDPGLPSLYGWIMTVGQTLGAPAMTAFYVCLVALLLQRERWRRRLAPLGFVGRMALTNYIMHSVVFTMISYSYGLGLFGQVGPALGLVLATAMFLVQIPLSRWWLTRFRFGPLEWLWRSLTYLRPQPLRRSAAP
jgi:uncharacterized protein